MVPLIENSIRSFQTKQKQGSLVHNEDYLHVSNLFIEVFRWAHIINNKKYNINLNLKNFISLFSVIFEEHFNMKSSSWNAFWVVHSLFYAPHKLNSDNYTQLWIKFKKKNFFFLVRFFWVSKAELCFEFFRIKAIQIIWKLLSRILALFLQIKWAFHSLLPHTKQWRQYNNFPNTAFFPLR